MRKCMKQVLLCGMIALLFWCGTVISDRQRLRQELIRLHVVANSDSAEDQHLKLQVRDAVIDSLRENMASIRDAETAKAYLQEKLPMIRETAEKTLRSLGCEDGLTVSLCREAFDTRFDETVSLPAGIYEALRITIGKGAGKNWWCVVFPEFYSPGSSDAVTEVAAGAGFSGKLAGTMTGQDGLEIRFALLDAMGKLENIFFPG